MGGNVDKKVFDVEYESVMGVDMKLYEFMGQVIGIGVVEIVKVQVVHEYTNHHFLFHLVLSTALHLHLEQTPHSSAFPFSDSPICLLASRCLRSMFQSCNCDVPSALCTPCRNACMTSPLETLPPEIVYMCIYVLYTYACICV